MEHVEYETVAVNISLFQDHKTICRGNLDDILNYDKVKYMIKRSLNEFKEQLEEIEKEKTAQFLKDPAPRFEISIHMSAKGFDLAKLDPKTVEAVQNIVAVKGRPVCFASPCSQRSRK